MAKTASMAFGPGYGGDGGFWMIGPDGKLHWVPPWDPELSRDLGVQLFGGSAISGLAVCGAKKIQRLISVGFAHDSGRVHGPRPMLCELQIRHAEGFKLWIAGDDLAMLH